MIYQLTDVMLIPGKMAAYSEIFNNELMPLFSELGMKIEGSFHAYTGDMNKVYHLWVYDDLAAYQKVREARSKVADFQKASARLNALRSGETFTLLEPNPWSPMK